MSHTNPKDFRENDEPIFEEPVTLLHIYAQYAEHSPALIRGNRAGLEALRAAIDVALEPGSNGGTAGVMPMDGEHYPVEVIHVNVQSEMGQPDYIYHAENRMMENRHMYFERYKIKEYLHGRKTDQAPRG